MTTLEILRAARDAIAMPDRWIKGDLAVDRNGDEVSPGDSAACRWCAEGAVFATPANMLEHDDAVVALESTLPCGFYVVDGFNDSDETSHGDVLALFDRAIEALEVTE